MFLRQHLVERGFQAPETEPTVVMDPEKGVATFLLWDLSGRLVGFQEYRPDAPKGQGPREDMRYWSLVSESARGLACWGLHTLKHDDPVVFLVEGVFDAVKFHSLGLPALALLGNAQHSDMKNWLRCLPQLKVAVLDRDAAGRKLASSGDRHLVVPEPWGDVGDMPVGAVRDLVAPYLGM